jgi:hypothetical protein
MKKFFLLILCAIQYNVFAQDVPEYEKSPVFPECETQTIQSFRDCFYQNVSQFVFNTFQIPQIVKDENYTGQIVVLFEVDAKGNFIVLYVDSTYKELETEARRVFGALPKIKPATYNGRATYKQYSFQIDIPLRVPELKDVKENNLKANINAISEIERHAKKEYDSVNNSLVPYEDLEYKSQLNIPFTHQAYSRFDRNLNVVGTNSHTSSKPFIYEEVSKYYDFDANKKALMKDKKTWMGRKLFNEHMVQLQSKDYWLTIDPIFDLQLGKDTDADFNTTYNNTRGVYVQGGLGKKFSFSASVYESQGRFAQYFNDFSESINTSGPLIVPGRGVSKRFNDDAFDYPVAEAYFSYTPSKYFNIQFGHGKNFIGDGYRSLFLSDVASPYPFLKLNTKFWKIKYTNTWMVLKDVRPEVEKDGAFLTKYMANHYLSWNASKRLNIGLFESVLWTDSNNRGFDINYLNPIIFYRAIEFETGSDAGNAIVGASAKYKWNDNINFYSQFVLDEFSLSDITGGNKSWKNKFGYQLGAKYYNAFKVENLMLQVEYNRVRPYTYSHNTVVLNYGHNNQSMAHLWGSNFSEAIIIGRYHYNRWFGDVKLVFGVKGFDYNDGTDNFSYGGDIFRDYNDRPFDNGVTVGQGIRTNIFHGELQTGYLINPLTNLKIFANISYRNFNPEIETINSINSSTVWFNIGLQTDLFNWYFDF